MIFYTKQKIDDLDVKWSREELLRRSRVLFIDDETPDIIADLKRAGFAVDHETDINSNNLEMIERPTYDLIVLDFGGVGTYFGNDEGLSLLRHLKRVNPAVIVFAYTSKALTTEHAGFYTATDGILPKDVGIGESMERIEDGLRQARDTKNLWKGLLNAIAVNPNSREDLELQDLFVRGLSKPKKMNSLRAKISNGTGGDLAEKAGLLILEKLIEAGLHAAMGG